MVEAVGEMSDVRMQASKASSLTRKPIPPKVHPRPKSICRHPEPSDRPASGAKYLEQSSPMKFGDAVEYFNPLPANVFVAIEGSYSPKGSRGVKKGECVLITAQCEDGFPPSPSD